MAKVVLVHITEIYDGEELRNDVRCFKTKKLAKEYAKAFIADEKEYVKRAGWTIESNFTKNGTWEAYEDGNYCMNHTEVTVSVEPIYEE